MAGFLAAALLQERFRLLQRRERRGAIALHERITSRLHHGAVGPTRLEVVLRRCQGRGQRQKPGNDRDEGVTHVVAREQGTYQAHASGGRVIGVDRLHPRRSLPRKRAAGVRTRTRGRRQSHRDEEDERIATGTHDERVSGRSDLGQRKHSPRELAMSAIGSSRFPGSFARMFIALGLRPRSRDDGPGMRGSSPRRRWFGPGPR